jgi:hypothetical protein
MEPKYALSCLEKPITFPYIKPDESSAHSQKPYL